MPSKLYDCTCNNILAQSCNRNDNDHVDNGFSYCNNVHCEDDKIPLTESYDINSILHS